MCARGALLCVGVRAFVCNVVVSCCVVLCAFVCDRVCACIVLCVLSWRCVRRFVFVVWLRCAFMCVGVGACV